jgi:hypothetical protein
VLIRDGALHRSVANLFQGGKFLRRKPHSATGKAWFWFQFCHSDLIILVTINAFQKGKRRCERGGNLSRSLTSAEQGFLNKLVEFINVTAKGEHDSKQSA